ncbi:MAG: RidA family protein [Rhodospirillales bacterium]
MTNRNDHIDRRHASARMSQIVATADTVYLAGQVATGNARGASVAVQTSEILATIDAYLDEMGTDKSKILQAQIWITDMAYFAEMNEVWDGWVDPDAKPVRACVQAALASPDWKVEIMVTAAR